MHGTELDLSELFLRQVDITPNATALQDGNRTWSYKEALDSIYRIVTQIQPYTNQADDLVGILLPHCANYVLASLAALFSEGAFLVLEVAYPRNQLLEVIEDAKPKVVVTCQALKSKMEGCKVPLLVLQEDDTMALELPSFDQVTKLQPGLAAGDSLAFVTYSSGTTGRPKGIANTHSAAIRSYNRRFQFNEVLPGDRVACNIFFVWEMLRPLLKGATVVIVPDEKSYDPVLLVNLLSSEHITETLMTPTLLRAVLNQHEKGELAEKLRNLKTLWLNGEVVKTDLARRAADALPTTTRLLNCYSASETHEIACGDIRAMLPEFDGNETICPVGKPWEDDNCRFYILKEDGKTPVDKGHTGELFVGSDQLARGYLNLSETTASAFLPDPVSDSGLLFYRTGDLARELSSGFVEISGRVGGVGGMIKMRGFSIQPGAVEAKVIKHLSFRDCLVVAHGDELDKKLVAYVIPPSPESIEAKAQIDEFGSFPAARKALLTELAEYMIPEQWVVLPSFPLHPVSGKIDLKQLLDPPPFFSSNGPGNDNGNDSANGTASIAQLWGEVLNRPSESITDEHTFLELGGHSLRLSDLAARLSKKFHCLVTVPLLLHGEDNLKSHLKVVQDALDGRVAASSEDLAKMLKEDSALGDICAGDLHTHQFRKLTEARVVLVTGATGFLGTHILQRLLATTCPETEILCLVRCDNSSQGLERVRQAMAKFGIVGVLEDMWKRVTVIPGHLKQKQLGLTPALSKRVDVIIHAAAHVNLAYPYKNLREANVEGTRRLLRLASTSGATFHFISTNGVLPPSTGAPGGKGWSEKHKIDCYDASRQLSNGYCQTKWAAEELVRKAADRGMPVRIHRPGTLSGASSGSSNPWDLQTALVVESLRLGKAPEPEWIMEMTPVDFVSEAILALCDKESDQLVYHLANPEPPTAELVFDKYRSLGFETTTLPWAEWMELWERDTSSTSADDATEPVKVLRSSMPALESMKAVPVLDNAATRAMLDGLSRVREPGPLLLGRYLRYYIARGWLPAHEPRGRLSGRRAVVTGASSGIGAAIAHKLAEEGADIILAARRTEALTLVEEACIDAATKNKVFTNRIISHKTDVRSPEEVKQLKLAATDNLGPIDILVNCAGVMYYSMMANPANLPDWNQTIDVNCKGLVNCLAEFVPGMIQGKGHVVAISSDAGRKVFPGLGVYSASKAFVEFTLQALRLETQGTGLRVTSVQPGNVATDLLGMSTDQEAIKKYGEPTGAKVLSAEEVANAVIFVLVQKEHIGLNELLIEPRDEPI